MAKLFNSYRPIKDTEPCTIDDEKHAFTINGDINNVQRSWSDHLINSIFVVLLVTIATLNVTLHTQLRRQMTLTEEASLSKFGKV